MKRSPGATISTVPSALITVARVLVVNSEHATIVVASCQGMPIVM